MESKNKLTMCRLCLGENECFLNIFEVNVWQGYVAAKVISDLLQFQVSETDIYPQVICSKCLLKLTDFQLFKECCQKSKVMYDNMFVASESLEEHKPEMDICDGGSGLELCEQDPLREETSDREEMAHQLLTHLTCAHSIIYSSPSGKLYPIIKQEELDISGDESEGTNTKVSFGPMLLQHEMLLFNGDSDSQDIGGYRSDSQLCEQDPLEEASSHVKLIELGPSVNYSTVKSVATVIDDTSRCKRTIYYHTLDNIKKNVQLLDQYKDEDGKQLRINVQEYRQSTKNSRKKGVKGHQNKTASSKEGINTQDAANTCRDHRKASVSTKVSEHKRPNCASKGEIDIDSCSGNIITSEESIIEKSKNISSSTEIEAPSSGMMERLDDQLILSGERMSTTPSFQRDVGIKKEREREGKETGGEEDEGRETAPGKEVKKDIGRFKCYHCGNMFISKQGLKQHMVLHGFGKSYPCDVCSKVFPAVGNLNRHILTHTGSKPHKCVECHKSFSLSQILKKHMRTHTGSKPYECVKCRKSFARSDTLKSHIGSHSGSKPYKCADCGNSFNQIGHLKGHMRIHTGSKPYKCTECSKCFKQSGTLTVHMRTHTGVKPFKCADCSKCFTRTSNLKTHIRTHTGSKPYKCVECNKSFSQSGYLIIHMRTHTGVKPYKCVECNKSFSQSGYLKIHMRTHTGVKPYKCVECNKSFSQSGYLKIHMRTHTGVKPYKCSQCGKCFTGNGQLKRHMRIHTGSKPYKCAECSKCFRDNSSFNRHVKSKTCCKTRKLAEGINILSK